MAYYYSNLEDKDNPHKLPNIEVFYIMPRDQAKDQDDILLTELYEPGYYWWPCFPGCLPDGDAVGPFETKQQAIEDAQNE